MPKKILSMYDEKNLIHILTMLECCEKAMIELIAPSQKLLKEFLATPYYKHLSFLLK